MSSFKTASNTCASRARHDAGTTAASSETAENRESLSVCRSPARQCVKTDYPALACRSRLQSRAGCSSRMGRGWLAGRPVVLRTLNALNRRCGAVARSLALASSAVVPSSPGSRSQTRDLRFFGMTPTAHWSCLHLKRRLRNVETSHCPTTVAGTITCLFVSRKASAMRSQEKFGDRGG